MFWTWLTADQWSALATVLSALVALVNLGVVFILVRYNKRVIRISEGQSRDLRAQAVIARETMFEMVEEKKRERGRLLTRLSVSFLDLNDNLLVLEGMIGRGEFDAAEHYPLRPTHWHEMRSAVIEFWPEGSKVTIQLEVKLRGIDRDLALLSKKLTGITMESGLYDLEQLVKDVRPLLHDVMEGLTAAMD